MPITKVLNPDFEKIITDHDMAIPLASGWVDLLYYNSAFLQVTWKNATGTLNATIHVEASNSQEEIDPPRFSESVKVLDTAEGEQGYNIWQLGARWYRLVYDCRGATGGLLNATITAKDA
jgi:hypothetical protein